MTVMKTTYGCIELNLGTDENKLKKIVDQYWNINSP